MLVTFQAAAGQLKDWASRLNLDVVSGHHGSDAAKLPLILIPPHWQKRIVYFWILPEGCKRSLMDELSKLSEFFEKEPCFSAFVVGCNAPPEQMACFSKDIPRDWTKRWLYKLDGTSKGGVIVSIYRELGIPIFYLGLGEWLMISAFSVKTIWFIIAHNFCIDECKNNSKQTLN